MYSGLFTGAHHDSLFKMIDFSSAIFNSQGFGFIIIDSDSHQIMYANSKFLSMSGFTPEMLIGKECHHLLCPAPKGACSICDLNQSVDNLERTLLCADGKIIPILKTVIPLHMDEKKYLIESIVDISAQKDMWELLSHNNEVLKTEIDKRLKVQNKLETLAYYDNLTGLPNRLMFIERLNQAVLLAERSAMQIVVMFLDLDGFKMINDTAGHVVGDELLAADAKRLVSVVRKCDIVARIGGDEFVIMFENIGDSNGIKSIMNKILVAFHKPFTIRGRDYFFTTSIGVSVYPEDGTNAEDLIQNADTAMYKAKERGRNQGILCTPDMQQNITEYMKLSNHLYRAMAKNELMLHYQPQINFSDNKIVGMEALVRWRHPEFGFVAPGKFIPIAEKTGLIHPIGEWMLRTACNQNKIWQDKGLLKIPVAVNFSELQFNNHCLVKNIDAILQESGLSPQYLELEITESVIMRESTSVINTLSSLRNIGISISIDDFGTGYSSLKYLKQLPINKLKIAMSFIQGLEAHKRGKAITKAIILLAKQMELRVIADGVETKDQLSFLKQAGCKEAQGYYFYKALSADEMEVVLKNGVLKPIFEE